MRPYKYQLTLMFLLMMIISSYQYNYTFIPEDEDIFMPCNEYPDNNLQIAFDLSNYTLIHTGDGFHSEGSIRRIWDAVEPTDRIELLLETYDIRRGTRQPTVFNLRRHDFCKVLWNPTEPWYSAWTSTIYEEDRECPNKQGVVWRFYPKDLDVTLLNIQGMDVSGRYEVVMKFRVYDGKGALRPDVFVCISVKGEVKRMR